MADASIRTIAAKPNAESLIKPGELVDLVDQRRAVRAHAVGHAVDLAHDLLVEHEAV